MHPTFSNEVKNVMSLAREEAKRLGNDCINADHLLLGILSDRNSLASNILSRQVDNIEEKIANLRKFLFTGMAFDVAEHIIPFTPEGKKLLEMAASEAHALGHHYITSIHLLLAIAKWLLGSSTSNLQPFCLDYGKVLKEVRAGRRTSTVYHAIDKKRLEEKLGQSTSVRAGHLIKMMINGKLFRLDVDRLLDEGYLIEVEETKKE